MNLLLFYIFDQLLYRKMIGGATIMQINTQKVNITGYIDYVVTVLSSISISLNVASIFFSLSYTHALLHDSFQVHIIVTSQKTVLF